MSKKSSTFALAFRKLIFLTFSGMLILEEI